MAAGYDIGLSESDSLSNTFGQGDFNVTDNSNGGGKKNPLVAVAIGAIILLALIAWLRRGK